MTAIEFKRIVTETSLGLDQITALEACAARMKCQELGWVAESMAVNRDVGGNLSDVLTGVADTIRSRIRLARQVHALSAEGRFSARVLNGVPVLAFLSQLLLNRKSIEKLFHGGGLVLLLIGLSAMVVGNLWVRRIVKVKF